MFQLSFLFLFTTSILSLFASVKELKHPKDPSSVDITWLSRVYAGGIIIFCVILTINSNFEVKYLLLVFMILSVLVDFTYYKRIAEAKRGGFSTPLQRSRWYPIIDNCLWVGIVPLLYFT